MVKELHSTWKLAVVSIVGLTFALSPSSLAAGLDTVEDLIGSLSEPSALTDLTAGTGSADCNGLFNTAYFPSDTVSIPTESYNFNTLTSWTDCGWRSGEDPTITVQRLGVYMYYVDSGTADYTCGTAQSTYNGDDIWFTDDSFTNYPVYVSCTMTCKNQFDVNLDYEFSTSWANDIALPQATLYPPIVPPPSPPHFCAQ